LEKSGVNQMFASLFKVALSPIDLAIGVTADVVTLGGALTDQEKPYTAQAGERMIDNAKDAFNPEKKDGK